MRQADRILFFGVNFCLAVYGLAVLYTNFQQGRFGYHDVTLISDFLSSTAHGRGFFWIAQEGISHIKMHFTPTLLLLVPFFRVFESQFTLLALFWILWLVGCWASTQTLRKLLPGFSATLLSFAVIGHVYVKSILIAAHFEVLFFGLASLLIYSLLTTRKKWIPITLLILTLGVRQDSGFFLGFLLLSTLFSREKLWKTSSRKRAIFAGMSFCYFIFASMVILPLLGGDAHESVHRFWGSLGNTWGEVFSYLLTHPSFTVARIQQSGFVGFQKTLVFLQWLNFPAALIGQLPGGLFYIADAPVKAQLHYYNSSFLLPSLFLSFGLGLYQINRRRNTVAMYFTYLILIGLSVAQIQHWRGIMGGQISYELQVFHSEQKNGFQTLVETCPKAESVSTGFQSIVWLSNSKTHFLLDHSAKADLVVFDPLKEKPDLNGKKLLKSEGQYQAWVKETFQCF